MTNTHSSSIRSIPCSSLHNIILEKCSPQDGDFVKKKTLPFLQKLYHITINTRAPWEVEFEILLQSAFLFNTLQ